MKLSDIGEFGMINNIKSQIKKRNTGTIIGIGDDTAVVKPSKNPLLSTIDTLVENVHFDLKYFSYYDLGWKLLAVNLSDIAAMGGSPTHFLVSLTLNSSVSQKNIRDLYRGMEALASIFKVDIVGGDTVSTNGPIVLTACVFGEAFKNKPILRSGARTGDLIMVTGIQGAAALGLRELIKGRKKNLSSNALRHLRPMPRVKEGQLLALTNLVSSMIDNSDGLSRSIYEICKASKKGANIYDQLIPLSKGGNIIDALDGGEDFELVFTVKNKYADIVADKLNRLSDAGVAIIGEIIAKPEKLYLIGAAGDISKIKVKGYQHFK